MPTNLRVTGRVIEGNGTPHRMAHENGVFPTEVVAEPFEIVVEGPPFELVGVTGGAVPTEVEGHDRGVSGEVGGQVAPPVGVRTAAVE